MRQFYCLFSRFLVRFSAVFLVICALQACSIFEPPLKSVSSQPGKELQKYALLYSLDSQETMVEFIHRYKFNPSDLEELVSANEQELSRFVINANRYGSIAKATDETAKTYPAKADVIVQLVLKLYPIDQYRVIEELVEVSSISEQNIKNGALLAGLDPEYLFDASASEDMTYRIEPLIHSASITLFNQTEDMQNGLMYKEVNETEWNKGLALQWEPIRGALSGSIVRLKANTDYQIKVTLTNQYDELEEQEYQFTTRTNSPPIDPDKIYQLADIYSGGQLNLEALGIEGSENGWAKIIGDSDTIVEALPEDMSAIHIGSQNYIMLENIKSKGGWRYGIHSKKAHHIWIKGCDISQWGRVATEYRNGKGYHKPESTTPINYDAGIYLERSGVAVIEDCEIHSPNGQANHWGNGHPNGPNALQVVAHHPTEAYRGQFIVRKNRFYGTPEKRFNDVVEGRYNSKSYGGFGRDSAIYGNYFAYANDDLIEIDGGQSNVLVYDNELTQGYCGISTAPNRIGPSYVFNNYIHDLGDERGKEWGAIKMGGLLSSPAGLTNVFENIIVTNRNGIVSASFKGDKTLWVNARNNTIITRRYSNLVGLGIYDSERYEGSSFVNNYIFNTVVESPVYDAIEGDDFLHPLSEQTEPLVSPEQIDRNFDLPVESAFVINNFSKIGMLEPPSDPTDDEQPDYIQVKEAELSSFAKQDKFGAVIELENGIQISGNNWKKMPLQYEIKENSLFKFHIEIEGDAEIVGLAFENNNSLSQNRTFKVDGSQRWGIEDETRTDADTGQNISLPVGEYVKGEMIYIVFVVDADDSSEKNAPTVKFTNMRFEE